MYEGLVTHRTPPEKRARHCEGEFEHYLSEGAVMLAFALHLLRTVPGLKQVAMHPDGEHGKRFDLQAWLERNGFRKLRGTGRTSYGGEYVSENGRTLIVDPSSGRGGDVIADAGGVSVVAECKGGVLNTRHSGQTSRLRQGLCETVGLSMASPPVPGRRQYVVVPDTPVTEKLARRMLPRVRAAGISIALVDGQGNVRDL